MPQVIDATVVNQPYDTSGNGGRKLVMLDNGWLVAGAKTNDSVYLYVDKQDGNGFAPLCNVIDSTLNANDFSLTSIGNRVFMILDANTVMRSYSIDTTVVSNVNIFSLSPYYQGNVDSGQTLWSGTSLIKNEAGTELHAAWSSKNSTYPNSLNVRYTKGTIETDGSVTWGAVEQVTTQNNSQVNYKNPSIVLNDGGLPRIAFDGQSSTNYYIIISNKNNGTWDSAVTVYAGTSYTQSSPSAIFVPQSINGLTNGRIWVAWHGFDSVDAGTWNVRISYSDDGGVTWSSMRKLTSGSSFERFSPSITFNKNNKGDVIIDGTDGTYRQIYKVSYDGSDWGSVSQITSFVSGTTPFYPSTLYEPTLNYSSPLFIYKNTQENKVGFYGEWSTIEISQPPGHLGEFTEPSALLTYNITSEEALDTITEKVNGVTVGTRNAPVSGQDYTVSLSQAQWDAVRFGKYSDTTGGLNTLEITMGDNTWAYTFDKRPANDSDILTAVKAVKDSQEVHLPNIKRQLVDKVGGSVADSFEEIIGGAVLGRKMASGTATSSSSTLAFTYASGSTRNWNYIEVTGLSFQPTTVVCVGATNGVASETTIMLPEEFPEATASSGGRVALTQGFNNATASTNSFNHKLDGVSAYSNNGSFRLPVPRGSAPFQWTAYE
jgi:hypothetical protein